MDNVIAMQPMENNMDYNNINQLPNQNYSSSNLNDSFLSRKGNEIGNKADQINNMYFTNSFNNPGLKINQPPNNHPQQNKNNMNFNQNMNSIVRNTLKSRGIVFTQDDEKKASFNYQNSPSMNKNFYGPEETENNERKKMLLDNIKQQINLTKNSKQVELERKKMEDDRYVKEMQEFYPFGR